MSEKVFLSYAVQDSELARSLARQLADAGAEVDVFDLKSSVTPDDDVRSAIKAAMDAASTVVILASPHGENSQWVNYEAGLADALGKNLVLVAMPGKARSLLVDRLAGSARVFEVDQRGRLPQSFCGALSG
ncbi:toll/interleukin-1 receptor domain-containing protein [Thauera sinica]|uniref:Toll/interleukin-1 receptor domain-containing protein n=1 Tax=Thauera sinica TaxID=2665146 RepID=A0ABW1AS38_9RHOO|nr:toll/interleukin-1 receptor domain-containing protein [Thauera sp. K11]